MPKRRRRQQAINTIGFGSATLGAKRHGKSTVVVAGAGTGYSAVRLHKIPKLDADPTPETIAVSHLYAVAAPGSPGDTIPDDQLQKLRSRFGSISGLGVASMRRINALFIQMPAAKRSQLASARIKIVSQIARK